MKQKTNIKTVRIDSNAEKVILKIKVGNGHPSLTTIYRDGNKITELTDPYPDYELDKKEKLIGSDLLVSSVVHDLPETPDRVLVTHTLHDPAGEIMLSEFDIPVDDGEVAICSTQVYFLKK